MKITYHGHSVVQIDTKGTTIWIDPFLTGNPLATVAADDVKANVIILTHGHGDHVGDTVSIAKRNDSLVIASAELSDWLSWQGVRTHAMSIGGASWLDFGRVKLTQAFHSSGYVDPDTQTIVYTGMPTGILLTIEDRTIYHAGDTGIFSDMKLIGELDRIDLAFLPIGDRHTMGPHDAALAAEWLQAKQVVPVHYNTFPMFKQDPYDFVELLQPGVGIVMHAGDLLDL